MADFSVNSDGTVRDLRATKEASSTGAPPVDPPGDTVIPKENETRWKGLAAAVLATALAISGAGYWYLTGEDEATRRGRVMAINRIGSSAEQIRSSFEKQQSYDRAWSHGRSDGASATPEKADTSKSIGRETVLHAYENRYRQIKQSNPTAPSEIESRAVALVEISQACADYVARGAIESYALQAVVDVEMGLFREVAVHLGLPEGSVPDNHFELLSATKLAEFESLQARKIAGIEERQSLFPGLFTVALKHETQVLEQIQSAKSKATFDPVAFFTTATRDKKLPPAVLTLVESDSVRASAIATREGQLIAIAAARDHTDLGLHLRYWQLQDQIPPEKRAQFAEFDSRIAILEQIRSSLPADPDQLRTAIRELAKEPSTVAEAAVKYSAFRLSDPVRAAELTVLLKDAYATATKKSVTPETEGVFQRWIAGHLTRGELYEISTFWLRGTMDLFAEMATVNVTTAAADRRSVEGMHEQFTVELTQRSQGASPDEPRVERTAIRPPPASQRVYNELQILEVFLPHNSPIATARRDRAVDGYVEQLDRLDKTRREVESAKEERSKAIFKLYSAGEVPEQTADIARTYEILAQAYTSIELGLDNLLREEPGSKSTEAARLRVKAGLSALPPPFSDLTSIRPAQPFADVGVARYINTTSQHITQLKAETESAVASHAMLEAEAARLKRITVEVFGRESCPRTTQVLEMYRAEGLIPVFRDVDNDASARRELRNVKLHKNVLPLVKVNGVNINGSGEELTFERLLNPCK